MNESRRNFLRVAGAAVAAMGIDPELLVWQPRQMIVVPAMPSNYVTLAEWARRMDPEFRISRIVELLSQANELLEDIKFVDRRHTPHARQSWAELVALSE